MEMATFQDGSAEDEHLGLLTQFLDNMGVDYQVMPGLVTGLGCPIAKDCDIKADQMAQLTVLKVKTLLIQVLHGFDSFLDSEKLKVVVSSDVRAATSDDLAECAFAQGLRRSLALPIHNHLFYLDKQLVDRSQLYIRVHEKSCLLRLNAKDLKKLISNINTADIATSITPYQNDDGGLDDEADVKKAVESFTQRRMKARLEQTLELPPIPVIATELIQLRADENASINDLVAIIEKDPGLAAQIVSWASSPYYGAGGVRSVKDAVLRVLGFEVVMNLALGLALTQSFKMPQEGPFGLYPFWEETIAIAHLMEAIAKMMLKAGVSVPVGLAYLAGLLANFGTFILAQVFPPYYQEINRCSELNPHVSEHFIDRLKLGVSRECIAAQLFKSWRLPQPVINAVRWQHHPNYAGEDHLLAKSLYLCHQLVRSQGLVYKHTQPLVASTVAGLGIDPGDLEVLCQQLPEMLSELTSLVNSVR